IFADSHNIVAYLEISEENADFAEIVDFLNASPIRYALTVSPTVYVSYIEQFWSTVKIKTVNNETQIRAKVNGKTIVITESSVRRDLYFNDEDGITCLTNTEIFENLQLMGSKSTAWNKFGTNIASTVICLAKKQKFNFSKLIFDVEGDGSGQPTESQHTPTTALPSHVEPIPIVASSSQPKKTQKHRKTKRKAIEVSQSCGPTTLVADDTVYKETGDSVERVATTATSLNAEQGSGGSPRRQDTILKDRPAQTRLSERVLALENIKTAQALEITHLKKRVKKLEKKKNSRTPQLKRRLFKVRIKSSTEKSLGDQEDASKQGRNADDQDEKISWFQEDAETQGRYGHDIKVNTASTSITTASINITTTEPVTTASAPVTTAGVSVSTAEPSTPPTTILIEDEDLTIAQTLMKMRSKGKDQIAFDEEVARRLEAQMQAEYEEEERVARQIEEEDNLISWDNTKAMMKADYELAQRLQEEEKGELTIEERSKLFVELMDKRKKHFAKLRIEEIRRKPPTKAQNRNQMCTYLKNMANYKHSQLKNKSFEEIQMLFDNTMKWVDSFVLMDSEVVEESKSQAEGSKKRTRKELDEESVKRQKLEDDAEKAELKACLEIVPDDDSAVNVESLATKYPIVDWMTHILGEDK
ncbi:hypothetical protein Tco_1431853, partial [Tanacetum coccineum]